MTGFGPAAAYECLIGRWSRAAAPAFLDFVDPGRLDRVLDQGCGTGALTAALIERWPALRITGVDLDADSVRRCRATWDSSCHEFVHCDAAATPFADGAFDAVLSMLLLMLVPQPEWVAAEARRVLRPGGTAAASTWEDESFELVQGFWEEALALDPRAPCRNGRSRCVREGELSACWRAAGLVDVRERALPVSMHFRDADEIWSALCRGVGPAGRYVLTLPGRSRHALRARLDRRWPAPALRLGARLLMVRGRRPAA